ncbi:hypothetical protein ASPWEDRAFT_42965 [Aspergillus wentii DTO 134E9]|uniref:Uncharacterized protein n=1 Tax=Aspergillus wentii DTO 134E9 TaxID=1073089 RepID=A0A1L9RDJ6_ASPWE|nr:uncharacterized protein ASPWEDRAFT_42965 [Aspergillus wentii DTO 134E9]KAI9933210.1 hypothetical protein MW887_007682 [Aspergillus wentii]OJJ32937.1 hypothetical protein ASPWEDRAFT_42965 [Aspergillus wentii DTO 134E9]
MHHNFVRAYSMDRAYSNDFFDDDIMDESETPPTSPRPPSSESMDLDNDRQPNHFIVAVDFGTTFSSVAYTVLRPGGKKAQVELDDIACISNYPGCENGVWGHRAEVPTESCYFKPNLKPKPIQGSRSCFKLRSRRVLESNNEDEEHAGPDLTDEMAGDTNETGPAYQGPDYWGYGVQKHFKDPDADRKRFQRVTRSKLLLDKSEYTRHLRKELHEVVLDLQKRGTIRSGTDFIVDYLILLLKHTKDELCRLRGFKNGDSVEFVLCVPVAWKRRACRRMESALREASCRSGFGKVLSHSVENLYIVSEPEAAAARVLTSKQQDIQVGDTILILDAGGGTVDAVTYKLKDTEPLRMEREAVRPEGVLCGSSFLNERFEQLLRQRLEGETYLNVDTGGGQKGITIEGIIGALVNQFESDKRAFDIMNPNFQGTSFFIHGLQSNEEKKFDPWRLNLDRGDLRYIFGDLLKGILDLMLRQIELADRQGILVKKVLLIGGFSASPSLNRYLKKHLHKRSRETGHLIDLLCQEMPETAVAFGGVLRALNREDGPTRVIQSSYGFQRTEPWAPEMIDAHKHSKPLKVDPNDGDLYVKNTIFWIVKKGDQVPPFSEHTITSIFTFSAQPNQRFICEEKLFVSDKRRESHYRKGHKNNKGAKEAGKIVVDMTFLRTDGHIQPIMPEGTHGQLHYRVEYQLVMIIDGYNMKYEARWGNSQEQRVLASEQINIASAFANIETEDGSEEGEDND